MGWLQCPQLRTLVVCSAAVFCAAAADAYPQPALESECVRPITIGLDTTLATSSGGVLFGSAPGQTFLARDTLIRAVRVWRVALQSVNFMEMQLFITETDSVGMPLTDRVVRQADHLSRPYGDGVHPILFEWIFDPPVSLPRPGRYAFFLQQYPCVVGYFDVMTRSTPDLYREGNFWLTSRSIGLGCILRTEPTPNSYADIIFQIDFCKASLPTTVRRSTWGALKTIYR